ncbi:uncharacterized protein isoform X2 [Choristoneura fumiferana]|uniref:uncharacterized protein isoform X2 n=1 Tax=Choristoneura fumiferana TaxID=7141 RepID=UPI003D15E5DF
MLIRLLIIYNFAFILTDPIFLKRRPVKSIRRGQYRSGKECIPLPSAPAIYSYVASNGEYKLADEGKTTCMPTTWKGVDIDVDEDESVNVYDVPTTESYEKTDPVNSNERSTHTSSTSAPFDGDKEWSPVTEERCHGRAICKDLLQG